ncbi:MAG: hypothetical protein ABMB14_20370 [Myxococcota bacterium]
MVWWIGLAYGAAPEIVVDELDPGFVLIGSASDDDAADGGYLGHFYHRAAAAAPTTTGRWTPGIDESGLFTVAGYVPYSPFATSVAMPFTIHAHGEIAAGALDESVIGGDFHEIFGGRVFKLVAGSHGYVEATDGSGEASTVNIGWDALRFTRVGEVGSAGEGDGCAASADCAGDLVCDPGVGVCRAPCTATGCGPGGTCDPGTALCDVWPAPGDTGASTPTGPGDTAAPTSATGTGGDDDDDGAAVSQPQVIPAPEGCGCASSGVGSGVGPGAGSAVALSIGCALATRRARRSTVAR